WMSMSGLNPPHLQAHHNTHHNASPEKQKSAQVRFSALNSICLYWKTALVFHVPQHRLTPANRCENRIKVVSLI
ncbi:hypothetical protein Q4491_19335, partial [Photobacterium sp. 2_MG-2023]|uniref:hypothetical protein n=1 Tax=Photobacterium sp. 2_MG-2023 TaxID=3062663 RepID=UPI0026E3E9A5